MGPMPDWIEAYHGADVTYVYGIPLLQPGATYDDPEVKFSVEIMKMWSNFAKTWYLHILHKLSLLFIHVLIFVVVVPQS